MLSKDFVISRFDSNSHAIGLAICIVAHKFISLIFVIYYPHKINYHIKKFSYSSII